MDADLATLPTPQSNTNVPYDIYLPLLQIARIGYDANDVKSWYATILDQLLHADMNYPVSTSDSNSIALVPSLDGTISSAADTSTIETNLCSSYVGNSNSLSFDAYTANDMAAASPHSAPSTYEPPTPAYDATSNFDFHPSPSYQPQFTPPLPVRTQVGPSTPVYSSAQFANQSTNAPMWAQPQRFDDYDDYPRKRSISQSPRYEMAMSSTAMPLLIPSTECSPPMPSSSLAPIYTSTEVMYLPPIAIIPSRKRRKGGSKGVKKFIQPLHVSRQSS